MGATEHPKLYCLVADCFLHHSLPASVRLRASIVGWLNSPPSVCLPPFVAPDCINQLHPDMPGLLFFVFLVSWGRIKAPLGWQGEWRDPYPMPMRVLGLVKWCLLVLFQVDWCAVFCAYLCGVGKCQAGAGGSAFLRGSVEVWQGFQRPNNWRERKTIGYIPKYYLVDRTTGPLSTF